jgi:hypothetical protein
MQIGMRSISKNSYVVIVKIQEHDLVGNPLRVASVVSEFQFLELYAKITVTHRFRISIYVPVRFYVNFQIS